MTLSEIRNVRSKVEINFIPGVWCYSSTIRGTLAGGGNQACTRKVQRFLFFYYYSCSRTERTKRIPSPSIFPGIFQRYIGITGGVKMGVKRPHHRINNNIQSANQRC